MTDCRTIYAYIDETGDRGSSSSRGASPIFGMAAILVEDAHGDEVRKAVEQLRSDFSVPAGKVMSWKDHVKKYEYRLHAAEVLGSLENITVLYAYADKTRLRPGSYVDDVNRFYTYVAGKMYTSIVWAVAYDYSDPTEAIIRFGHVRGHNHAATNAYLKNNIPRTKENFPTEVVKSIRWVSADQYLESQAADLYGGFLKAALWPTPQRWGPGRPQWDFLKTIWHQVRRGRDGKATPLGLFAMPDEQAFTSAAGFCLPDCR